MSVVVVHRALGSFSLQYVQLTDFSPDCASEAGGVESGDLPLTKQSGIDLTGVMACLDEVFPVGSQRSLNSAPLLQFQRYVDIFFHQKGY